MKKEADMSNRFPLEVVMDLTRKQADAAAAALAQLRAKERTASDTLQMLETCRQDYHCRLEQASQSGIGNEQWRNYHEFLGKVDQAITQQKEVLPWTATSAPGVAGGQPLFKPVATTVVSSEPLPGRMAIGGPLPTTVDAQSAPAATTGVAIAPIGMATAALDPNAAAAKPVTAPTPRAEHRSSGNRGYSRREGPGTPRYNLLLSLGGAY